MSTGHSTSKSGKRSADLLGVARRTLPRLDVLERAVGLGLSWTRAGDDIEALI